MKLLGSVSAWKEAKWVCSVRGGESDKVGDGRRKYKIKERGVLVMKLFRQTTHKTDSASPVELLFDPKLQKVDSPVKLNYTKQAPYVHY